MKRFNVYYEENTGTIRSISPVLTSEHSDCSVSTIDYDTALLFLTGVYDPSSWFVNPHSNENQCSLTQNQFDLLPMGNNNIESIPRENISHKVTSAIFITVFTKSKIIQVSIPANKNSVLLDRYTNTDMVLYLTKRNDPSYVVAEFTIPVNQLFSTGNIQLSFKSDLNDYSVYTKKLFRFYQLKVTKSLFGKVINNGRINKLVMYTTVKSNHDVIYGILVNHNINTNELSIQLIDSETDIHNEYNISSIILYLTKDRDPTILIHTINIDFMTLISGECITVPLPLIGDTFGISSYPYTDSLNFMRT